MKNNNPNDGEFDNWDPEHPSDNFFYMGPYNDNFKNMWDDWKKIQKDNEANYMSFDDIMKMFGNFDNMKKPNKNPRRPRNTPDMR